MKKWISCILSLYVLYAAVLPCSVADNCDESQKTEQTSKHDGHKNCEDCPPFSMCSAGHPFTVNSATATAAPIICNDPEPSGIYHYSVLTGYFSSHFQPPRLG